MKRAVFMDRDGTLIREKHFLHDPELIEVIPGVREALESLKSEGYSLIVVTNQSGIARGYYTIEDARAVNSELNRLVGGVIDDFFICPHYPDITGACPCRKPGTEMLEQASERHGIELSASVIVGDRESDVECGIRAGLAGWFLVLTGYGKQAIPPPGTVVLDSFANLPDNL